MTTPRRTLALLALLLAALAPAPGCGGDDGGGDATTPDAPAGPIGLSFLAPAPGATFTTAALDAWGFLVADVPIELAITGAPSRVVIARDGQIVGEIGADGTGTAHVPRPGGAATLVAIAYDDAGMPTASAQLEVVVEEPGDLSCHEWLDLYQVAYETGPDSPGVDAPITAVTPINGLAWRYVENEEPRPDLFGGCELIRSLAIAAPYLRRRDIVEVADIGVYNYRCIGGVGVPPDCPNGISQHAYANAIDIAGVTTSDGTYSSVNDDWVIDGDAEETCAAASEPGADRLLHELICELKAAQVWNIVLTPNYNADHRNHFHVDLTPGADTIHRQAPTGRRRDVVPTPEAATCAH